MRGLSLWLAPPGMKQPRASQALTPTTLVLATAFACSVSYVCVGGRWLHRKWTEGVRFHELLANLALAFCILSTR